MYAAIFNDQLHVVKQLYELCSPTCDFTQVVLQAIEYDALDIVWWFLEKYKKKIITLNVKQIMKSQLEYICKEQYNFILDSFNDAIIDIPSNSSIITDSLWKVYLNNNKSILDWLIKKFELKTKKIGKSGLEMFLYESGSINWILNVFGKDYILDIIETPNKQIWECCWRGELCAVKELYEKLRKNPDKEYNNVLYKCLRIAAIHGYEYIVDWVLSRIGSSLIKHKHYTVVTECLQRHKVNMAKYLLNQLCRRKKNYIWIILLTNIYLKGNGSMVINML